MIDTDDEALLRRVARGDRAAFAALHERTAPWLAMRLRRRCADDDIVADVLQETYVAVWRAAGSFTGGSAGSAAGWIWSIAARRLVDAFRRRARDANVPALALPEETAPSAEEQVMRDELDDELVVALGSLSPEMRATLQATVLDGLTLREASVVLGVAEGTVKARIHRARSFLREALT